MTAPIPTLELADEVLREWTDGEEVMAAFLAGSVALGKAAAGSDIDAVIVYPHLDNALRETHERQGVAVELFIHDPDTLAFFWEEDRRSGRPTLARMVANGLPIAGDAAVIEELKRRAKAVLDSGPPPLSTEDLNRRRYLITDLAADLIAERTRGERLALGARLYTELADFSLRAAGQWSGSGKSLAQALMRRDPMLASAFEHAFSDLFASGDAGEVQALVDLCLTPHGGRLMAGDRRTAPGDARLQD